MSIIKIKKCLIPSALLLSLGSIAYGAQPPNVVVSDSNGNTAMGSSALLYNMTGVSNTASGSQALLSNTTGSGNTASGDSALLANTTGSNNTASGVASLGSNTTGENNTAFGAYALGNSTAGFSNTASGAGALRFNSTGSQNTAFGEAALWNNTSGNNNIASGLQALFSNTVGEDNIASGVNALYNSTGSRNIALGSSAGSSLTTGSDNIDIANPGVAADSGTIRIGVQGTQRTAFIAGVWGNRVRKGASVVVNSSGQIGVEESSERYKTDISSIRPSSEAIQRLRPVTYRLKTDPTGALQYGLIAEEVNRVYPELVVRDDAGNIEGVRYDRLAPILLSEVQEQQRKLAAQDKKLATQASQLGQLKQQFAQLQELSRAMQVALGEVQAKQSRVAMR